MDKCFIPILSVLFVCMTSCTFSLRIPIEIETESNKTENELNQETIYFLGKIGNKRFFHADASLNWIQAGERCTSFGMSLASVSSQVELDFLASKHASNFGNRFYWTSGREARAPRMFTWNSTGEQPAVEITNESHGYLSSNYYVCLGYLAWDDMLLEMLQCTEKNNVLCELVESPIFADKNGISLNISWESSLIVSPFEESIPHVLRHVPDFQNAISSLNLKDIK